MSFFVRAAAVLRKDLLIEARNRQAMNSMVFFAGAVLLVLGIATGPEASAVRKAAPGLLWIALVFTAVLGLGRIFDSERENRGIEGLFLYPGDRRAVFVGKFLALALILFVAESVLFTLAAFLYNLNLWPVLPQVALVALLGTLGLAGIGTLYGALTLNLRAREVLLPLLVFPLVVPLVLASVACTRLLLEGDPFGELGGWIRLLGSFAIVFTVAPLLVFERVLAE
jgi:heme exporter protein B